MKTFLSALLFLCLLAPMLTSCIDESDKPPEIDVDLTALSGIMAYAEVVNIVSYPERYIGKSVKINGEYEAAYYEGKYYHFIFLDGVDVCCPPIDLMFVWSGDRVYPTDYPTPGTRIEFVGVFRSYDEFDFEFYCFDVDDLVIVDGSDHALIN